MSYGTIYTLPFQSIKGVDYMVEIQKEDYTGRSIELKGSGDTPFSVELADEDFLYIPSRFSTATIRVVGNDYLQSLYSTGYQQYRVNFKRGGSVVWTGFVTPELYTQDYTSTLFDLEIQCVSAMSTLEYIKYKEVGENRAFVSLWDLLKKCITESRGSYSSVYVPHVYAKDAASYNTAANVLQTMTVSEQDFFDEDDEAMTLKEVLEEVCKLLNWTCADWRGNLYFVDVDHKGAYRKYTPDLGSFESVSANTVKVQDIGFAGSDHTLDILGGYNKAVVRVSNYCVGGGLADEQFDDLKKLALPNDLKSEDKVCHMEILTPNIIKMSQYTPVGMETIKNLSEYKDRPSDLLSLYGALPVRYCIYTEKDGKPDITDYNYTNVIRVNQGGSGESPSIINGEGNTPLFKITAPPASYSQCALSISGAVKVFAKSYSLSPFANNLLFGSDWLYISLRIGRNYYNGSDWVQDENARFYPEYVNKTIISEGEHGFTEFKDTKTLKMPYQGLKGYIIPIDKNKRIDGDLELIVYGLRNRYNNPTFQGSGGAILQQYGYISGFFLKDFKLSYQKEDGVADDLDNNSDRYYENVVNESYVNPSDEIEFKISSYNNDGACYSKVMLGDNYLTDNLYSAIEAKPVRPEEALIRRIVNQYSATKNRLTQVLMYSDSITPITTVTDKFQPDKRFIVTGGVIDFAADSFNVTMLQNGN